MKNMIKLLLFFALIFGVSFSLTGCSGKIYSRGEVGAINTAFTGTIVRMDPVKVEGKGVGNLIGAIIGGVIGHQFGKGAGNALATMGGTLAGSIAGENADYVEGYKITVKLDDGNVITTILTKEDMGNYFYKVGDRVKVFVAGNRVTEMEKIGR